MAKINHSEILCEVLDMLETLTAPTPAQRERMAKLKGQLCPIEKTEEKKD